MGPHGSPGGDVDGGQGALGGRGGDGSGSGSGVVLQIVMLMVSAAQMAKIRMAPTMARNRTLSSRDMPH